MFCLAIVRLILHLRVVAGHPYSSREYSVLDLQHLQRGVLAVSLVSNISSFCGNAFRSLLPFVHFLVNARTVFIPRSEFLLSPKNSS